MPENNIEQKPKDILSEGLLTLYEEKYGIGESSESQELIRAYMNDIVSREEVFSPVIMDEDGKPVSFFIAYCGNRENVIQNFSNEYNQHISSILDMGVEYSRIEEEMEEFIKIIEQNTENCGRVVCIIDMGGRLGEAGEETDQYIIRNTSIVLKNYFNSNRLSTGFWLANANDPMIDIVDKKMFEVEIIRISDRNIVKLELK